MVCVKKNRVAVLRMVTNVYKNTFIVTLTQLFEELLFPNCNQKMRKTNSSSVVRTVPIVKEVLQYFQWYRCHRSVRIVSLQKRPSDWTTISESPRLDQMGRMSFPSISSSAISYKKSPCTVAGNFIVMIFVCIPEQFSCH